MGNACCSASGSSKTSRGKRRGELGFYALSHAESEEDGRSSRRGSDRSMTHSKRGSSRVHVNLKTPQHNKNSLWHKRNRTALIQELYCLDESSSSQRLSLLHVRRTHGRTQQSMLALSSRLLSFDRSQINPSKSSLFALKRIIKREEVIPNGKVISNSQDVHKEADALEHLYNPHHPCCLRLVEVFEDREAYHLIMDPVPKYDLLEWLVLATSSQHISCQPEELAAEILSQVARCLTRCHERMVVHRNISLDTILLLEPSPLKHSSRPSEGGILGASTASHSFSLLPSMVHTESQTHTHSHLAKTPGLSQSPLPYRAILSGLEHAVFIHKGNQGCISIRGPSLFAAPEMVVKHKAKTDPQVPFYSREVDIWSLGVLLHTLLIGRFPFVGESEELTHQAILSSNEDDAKGDRFASLGVSHEAKSLLESLLQYDPSDRITASEILDHPFFYSSRKRGTLSQATSQDNDKSYERLRKESHRLFTSLSSLRISHYQAHRLIDNLLPLSFRSASISLDRILSQNPSLGQLPVSINDIFSFLYEQSSLDAFTIRDILEAISPSLGSIQDVQLLLASCITLSSHSYDKLQVQVVSHVQLGSTPLSCEVVTTIDIMSLLSARSKLALQKINSHNHQSIPHLPGLPLPLISLDQPQGLINHPPAEGALLTSRPQQVPSQSPRPLQLPPSPLPRGSSPPSPRLSPFSASSRPGSSPKAGRLSNNNQPMMLEEEADQQSRLGSQLHGSGSFKKIDLSPSSPKHILSKTEGGKELRMSSFTQIPSAALVLERESERSSGSESSRGSRASSMPRILQSASSPHQVPQGPTSPLGDGASSIRQSNLKPNPRSTISKAWGEEA